MKKAFIYKIQNLENGKMYIGSTSRPVKRKHEHFASLKNNCHHSSYLQNSWNKHGEHMFEFSIIDECNEDVKFSTEKSWVIKEQTYLPEWGYNMAIPEEGGGYTHTEYHKQIKREKSKINTNRIWAEKRASGKSQIIVIDLITGEKEYHPLKGNCPINFKNNNFNFAKNKFMTTTYNKTEEQIQEEFEVIRLRYVEYLKSNGLVDGKREGLIYKIDKKTLVTVGTFDNIGSAALDINIRKQVIRDCLNGLSTSIKGFMYTRDLRNVTRIDYSRDRKISIAGVVYDSWKECSIITGLTKDQIIAGIRSKSNPDMFWINTPTKKMLKVNKIPKIITSKRIVDGNGVEYVSVSAAAKELGLLTKKIYEVLSGRVKTTKGHSFRYCQ